jgi:hypothetical protein
MGTRAVSVRAENRGTGPCFLEGVPAVRLAQDGRPVVLTVEPGTPGDPFLGDPTGRVGLAPGDAATFALLWRLGVPPPDSAVQSLQVMPASGGGWSDVPLGTGPAPFDVGDGDPVSIGAWVRE